MVKLRQQIGVTLFEVTIVLAISAGLLASIIASQGALKRSSSFTVAVDKTVGLLNNTQNEATSAVINGRTGVGASGTSEVFGKMVEFMDSDRSHVRISTLVVADADHRVAPFSETNMSKCDTHTVPLESGVEFDNQGGMIHNQTIIFTANSEFGPARLFATSDGGQVTGGNLCTGGTQGPVDNSGGGTNTLDPANYLSSGPFTSLTVIRLTDHARHGNINITPLQNSITRTID